MDLGVAGTIGVEHIIGDGCMSTLINAWLHDNADVEVIEIKFATGMGGDPVSEVLIIYRKEVE